MLEAQYWKVGAGRHGPAAVEAHCGDTAAAGAFEAEHTPGRQRRHAAERLSHLRPSPRAAAQYRHGPAGTPGRALCLPGTCAPARQPPPPAAAGRWPGGLHRNHEREAGRHRQLFGPLHRSLARHSTAATLTAAALETALTLHRSNRAWCDLLLVCCIHVGSRLQQHIYAAQCARRAVKRRRPQRRAAVVGARVDCKACR